MKPLAEQVAERLTASAYQDDKSIESPWMNITRYKALGFSCYGTLVDRNRGVLEALRPLLEATTQRVSDEEVLQLYRDLISEERRKASKVGQQQLHYQVHGKIARTLGVALDEKSKWEQAMEFGNRIAQWPIYEDVPGALQYLSKFYRLVVLMPADAGNSDMFSDRLPVTFDAHVVYQGQDRHEALAGSLAGAGLSREEVLPVCSQEIDDPWRELIDFPICTLHRKNAQPWSDEALAPRAKRLELSSMADLVLAHQNALRC